MIRIFCNGFAEDAILVVVTCVQVTNSLRFEESSCLSSEPGSIKRTELRSSENEDSANFKGVWKYSSNKISLVTGPRCPEGSRKLRFPDYVTISQDGGKVVSLTYRPLFTPRKYSWYSFRLEAGSTPGS